MQELRKVHVAYLISTDVIKPALHLRVARVTVQDDVRMDVRVRASPHLVDSTRVLSRLSVRTSSCTVTCTTRKRKASLITRSFCKYRCVGREQTLCCRRRNGFLQTLRGSELCARDPASARKKGE